MPRIKPKLPRISDQPRAVRDFVKHVHKVCREHNIRVYLSKGSKIVYGASSGGSKADRQMGAGCFEEPEGKESGVLTVAMRQNRLMWLGTLAHEFSHVLQWLECEPEYCGTNLARAPHDASHLVDSWLDLTKDYSKIKVRQCVQKILNCELDNEKRTVELIKKFKLPIDIGAYIESANSYLFFHQVMFENRTWYNKKMFTKDVNQHMPDHFLPNASYTIGKMPREYVDYLEQVVINPTGWSWKKRRSTSQMGRRRSAKAV